MLALWLYSCPQGASLCRSLAHPDTAQTLDSVSQTTYYVQVQSQLDLTAPEVVGPQV
jgi:hypothetical protein